jgi:hypothetical protein
MPAHTADDALPSIGPEARSCRYVRKRCAAAELLGDGARRERRGDLSVGQWG